MTKYDIKKVNGTSKNGKNFQCLQIVAHTDYGDYTSGYIFPSSFRPSTPVDWFNDSSNSRLSRDTSMPEQPSKIGAIYSDQEDFFND